MKGASCMIQITDQRRRASFIGNVPNSEYVKMKEILVKSDFGVIDKEDKLTQAETGQLSIPILVKP